MATASVGLQGLWVELLTPLTEDLFIHHAKLSTHVKTLGAKGIQGVVMFSHVGEGDSFNAAERLDAMFGPDAQIGFFADKQFELIGQIGEAFVVGCGRQQHHFTFVFADVFSDGTVAFAFVVAQIVTFVNDNQSEAPQFRQDTCDHALRNDFGTQAIVVGVPFPHINEVFGTENQRFHIEIFLEDACHRGSGNGFTQPNHIADDDAVALVEVVGGESYGFALEFKQRIVEFFGNFEIAVSGFAG